MEASHISSPDIFHKIESSGLSAKVASITGWYDNFRGLVTICGGSQEEAANKWNRIFSKAPYQPSSEGVK